MVFLNVKNNIQESWMSQISLAIENGGKDWKETWAIRFLHESKSESEDWIKTTMEIGIGL